MAAKGAIAKEWVAKKLAAAFGDDFLGEYDKKYYINAVENGERVQVAIAMTCPKVPVEFTSAATSGYVQVGDFDFSDDAPVAKVAAVAAAPSQPIEISEKEREDLAALMARLGL